MVTLSLSLSLVLVLVLCLIRASFFFGCRRHFSTEVLPPHQVDALRIAVDAEYNDSASPVAHYPGFSKAGRLQIVQWLIRNRLRQLRSGDSQQALRDLIRSNRQLPALQEIEW